MTVIEGSRCASIRLLMRTPRSRVDGHEREGGRAMSAAQSAASGKTSYEQSSEAPDWVAVAADAWEAPSWKAAAREYHEARGHVGGKPSQPPDPQLLALLDPKVSLEQAQRRLFEYRQDGAAASTVEALMFGLRDGIEALPANPDRLRRLSELSADQLKEVCARLQNFKPTIARPWTADEVAALVRIWGKSHE
jgi:hypothetical protein